MEVAEIDNKAEKPATPATGGIRTVNKRVDETKSVTCSKGQSEIKQAKFFIKNQTIREKTVRLR